jgi:putative tryptophan/tyrosine transport system substrate-binding protein
MTFRCAPHRQAEFAIIACAARRQPAKKVLAIQVARAFLQGLRQLGYVEGKNLHVKWRSSEGKFEKLPAIIQQLVAEKVDVIVAPPNIVTKVAMTVTQTIPIVMVGNVSPARQGLVKSLAIPGGNVTGLSYDANLDEIISKRIDIFRELLPKVTRLAWLTFAETDSSSRKDFEIVSRNLCFNLLVADHTPTDYRDAFALITRERAGAVYVGSGGLITALTDV